MAAGFDEMNTDNSKSRIIAVVGVDGSGKTTITDWLKDELESRNYNPGFIWSRFNNYASLPFLAATRLTGHNYYRTHADTKMGFHNFELFPLPLRYMFIGMQIIDVNIATLLKIRIPCRSVPVTICERGPWDTLVDVATDTGLSGMSHPILNKAFCWQLAKQTDMVLIDRNVDSIIESRPELKFDTKLPVRHEMYKQLARDNNWSILDNNADLKDTKKAFVELLDAKGY